MPRIAIDISPTIDGNSVRGVGYYTKHLIESLQLEVKSDPQYKNWHIDLITDHRAPATDYDLIHYPYFDLFKLTLPPRKQTPIIVTVHDLIPRQFKSHFPVGIKGELKWLFQKHRLLQTDYIITVSHYSKYVIHDLTRYPTDRIYPIWEAASDSFKPGPPDKIIKSKYQLPDKFVLFAGDINWNKNVPNLVKACLQLKFHLVIAGSAATKTVIPHPWNDDIIWLQSQRSKYLHLLGFVPDSDLPKIYNLATIYCQPSYAEGFGLPVVEAMKSGCPVCYSDTTSLPEIVDFNGDMFNPHSQDSIQRSLKKLWHNKTLRDELASLGLKRSKIFSWRLTASQTLAVYKLALMDEKK